ncbi:MAG: homoserine O-succinyltransferase [Acidimicrobiales bacterium]|nr:homoserine O-succinyltransferase [Acidimicrobiales bacterium]
MPIRLPEDLPAFDTLRHEGVYVMSEAVAERQDIRPLRIALLNLMPNKIDTETQFSRLIGATPLQIQLSLVRMSEHRPKNTPAIHLEQFYVPFSDVASDRFDGLIITGAPIETLPFEQVGYWAELEQVFEWTRTHVHSTMAVCWGGMAALHHFYGVPKVELADKLFGCFVHENLAPTSPYLRGISDEFVVPVSRWTSIPRDEIDRVGALRVLVDSEVSGPCLVEDPTHRLLVNLNHFEYDTHSLRGEYERDIAAGKPIAVPVNYFPGDDPSRAPQNRWKSSAHLLFGNWINEIYQTTPFEVDRIGTV